MRLAFLALSLLVAACGPRADPVGTTASEDQALNDAAAMLDANSIDANALADEPEPQASQDQPQ